MTKRLIQILFDTNNPGLLWCLGCLLICSPCLAQVDAITMASHDLKLGFTVSGRLDKVAVEAGDRVKAGDLLMELDDKEGEAMVAQYTLKANSDLAVRSAEEQSRLADVEKKAIQQLYDKNAATPIEVERAVVKAAIAKLNVQTAQQELEETKHLLAQAIARHSRYQLYAPIDGVVDTLVGRAGETVESLKPILRLVNTDMLYIDAPTPTRQTLDLKPGDRVWVRFAIRPDAPLAIGHILYLAQVADSASDTRIVRIQTPNPLGLPAGGTVTVYFAPPDSVDDTSAKSYAPAHTNTPATPAVSPQLKVSDRSPSGKVEH